MKRKVLLTVALAIAFLAIGSLALAQYTPSVPNLINFQGRLTDNVGNPVVNGPHTVDFYIYPVRTGGGFIWGESQTPTTTGGLFTTQLGLVNPLPLTLFEDYDSLFLEIVADGNLISPRTLLTATPSARVANGLEVQSLYNPAVSGVKISPFGTGHHIEIESQADGLFNQQHGGLDFGESWWSNGNPSHTVTARIGAYPFFGGELGLRDDFGIPRITLSAGNPGDASAILPTDAVNSGEILDEPGVSNRDHAPFFSMSTAFSVFVVDSVDITIPAAGYVEVTCGGFLGINHVNGDGADEIDLVSGKTSGLFEFVPGWAPAYVPAAAPTGIYIFPATSTRLYAEGSAATIRYYLHLYNESPSIAHYAGGLYIRAKYYPTLYGTVALAKEGVSGTPAGASVAAANRSLPVAETEVTTITPADHNARLEAERAKQIAELEARIKRLEGQMAGQLPGQGVEAPRKER